MPQFLETRYNRSVLLIMAVFWLFLYIIVNLTSILYLGALAIDTLLGGHLHIIMIGLLLMALLIGLGGLKVIGYTDVIQVAVLIIGGFATVIWLFISPGVFAMFLLGMFWKRTTGTAALVGVLLGFLLAILFNNFAVDIFGKETWLYTAFTYEKLENGVIHTITEIPFLINIGWSFLITVLVMVSVSLAGPKVNPKAFAIDAAMFKVDSRTLVLIVVTVLFRTAIYVRFW